jgi:ribosome-associated protein
MRRPDETPSAADQAAARPSKTRRKADMDKLQALGEALVDVDPARLDELALPERLAEAIAATRRIKQHEARRRQVQFIGRLMRDVEADLIRARLAEWTDAPRREKARLKAAETWRARLLADAAALDELCAECQAADRAALARLVELASLEHNRGGPPHAFRELFRAIAALIPTNNG